MTGALVLEAGTARAQIDPQDGGRIVSLVVAGTELLGGASTAVVDHGSFVMAPWAGRIRDGVLRAGGRLHRLPTDRTHPHAGHGLVMDRPWEVLLAEPGRVRLRCGLDGRWPWRGSVEQEFVLHPDRLEQAVQVHALEEEFPATIGWHPWFLREPVPGARAELDFTVDGMLQRDGTGIPDGSVVPVPPGPWDDCFSGVQWPVVLTWPGLLRLRITADVDYLVIYDERSSALCVEPQSGPPDGPNTDPQPARPGAPVSASTVWAWQELDGRT
jgi:galactose mutarotase-like enzyme